MRAQRLRCAVEARVRAAEVAAADGVAVTVVVPAGLGEAPDLTVRVAKTPSASAAPRMAAETVTATRRRARPIRLALFVLMTRPFVSAGGPAAIRVARAPSIVRGG